MPDRPAVFTIPSHRSFADALAAGLIARFGKEPLGLAQGRILLPNNRAVRPVTDAFVRKSGSGLLLPRLIPVGDPELNERIGGALDGVDDVLPPAIDPTERLLRLVALVRGEGSAESLRLAADLARALDALLIEEIEPRKLKDAVAGTPDLALHWEKSLEKLKLIYENWPALLAADGVVDLAERRNRVLRQLAERWRDEPPPGFTVAAGTTTAAPAVAAAVAKAIALGLRETRGRPGKTASLMPPDRQLAARVSALLACWGIAAADSAGKAFSETPAGTLLLGIASAAAEELAPVPLLALL